MKIPGIDVTSMGRSLLLMLPVIVLIGLRFGPLLTTLVILFIQPLTMLRTRLIGPPEMNQALADERRRAMIILVSVVVGAFLVWIPLNNTFPDDKQLTSALFLLAVIALFAWFRPSMAVVPIIFITAAGGAVLLLTAAPLVVMLARRDQRCRLKMRRSLRRTGMTLLYAFGAFLATLLFANASAGSPPEGGSLLETPASPTDEGSWYDQFSNWLFQRGGVDTSAPSRPVQVPGQGEGSMPPEPTPWLLYLALAAAVAAVVAAFVWFRRRRRNRFDDFDSNAALTLARLETIGASVGRRRAPNEGALTFASELASHTADSRIAKAGPLVSGDVYGSTAVEPQLVASQLAAVEASPPPPPPTPPRMERIAERVSGLPVTRRGVLVSATGLVGLGALIWFGAPRLGDLRDPIDRELAYVEQADEPDEWLRLMATPSNDLIGWESCGSTGYNDELGVVSAGLSHRDEPLGAEMTTIGAPTDFQYGSLSVGTDEKTASIRIDGTGIGPSPMDGELWRGGDWRSVPVQPFSTVDSVLAAVAARETIRTDFVDRNGDHFARYESLPPDLDVVYGDEPRISPISLDDYELMQAVDIWTDDAGLPVRVRLISDGPDGQWIEWRRLNEISDARLVFPSCEAERPWANEDWIGIEAWTPSRTAPQLIDFDDAGNPFDLSPWTSDEEIADEPSGTIPGPIDVLSVGDLNSISVLAEEDWKQEFTFDVQWEAGAEMTLITGDDWPVATRIDAVGESVAEWDEFEDFYLYESFVTVVTAPTFPEFEADALDVFLEPLWDGETHVAVGIDGDLGLTLLTQSDTTGIAVGRNADGDIVSLLIWTDWLPWRSFGFEGTPPPSVTDREAQLHACLAGDRAFDLSGTCTWTD